MHSKRFVALLLVAVLAACRHGQTAGPQAQLPRVQSPQFINNSNPPLEPAGRSPVTEVGGWCLLQTGSQRWRLCNIHYHRPAEHVTAFVGPTLPPCPGAEGTNPQEWVEIHYAYCYAGRSRSCNQQTCPALRACALETELGGLDCPAPFVVRSIWARITPTGGFRPAEDPLPPSGYYAEYDGSSTGGSGGVFPAYWKINRNCVEITQAALAGVHLDPTRPLQPNAPQSLRPRSTTGN
ncbi:MAG TPA: hypothetical protein VN380_23045 [Thermoanaerobaculia bacterium]|jgi:hypothetical protein|nr:hypothetical protein [Thermoanaerobaculia bacterium]